MKKAFFRLLFALLLGLLLSLSYLFSWFPEVLLRVDNQLRDQLFKVRGVLPQHDNVVIIDIDEPSLKTYGQWPWSRDMIATLLERLSAQGAGIIGLDMVFSEADKTSPSFMAKRFSALQMSAHLPDFDNMLAQTFMNTPTIGGYIFIFEENNQTQTPLIPANFIERSTRSDAFIIKPKGIIVNIPMLQDALYSSGFFNVTMGGGIARSVPLIMKYDEVVYPSLALEMVRIFTNVNTVDIESDDVGIQAITLDDFSIPTDTFGQLFVNLRGPSHTFRYISAKEVLDGAPIDVKGKFVLVGTSSLGLADLRATAFDELMPGVEMHANVIDNMLEKDFIYRPSEAVMYDLLLILVTSMVSVMILTYLNVWLVVPFIFLELFLLYRFYLYTLFSEHILLNIIFVLLALLLSTLLVLGLDYALANRQKEIIKRLFAKKVSDAVMEDLIAHRQQKLLEPSEKEVSIFFSDIRSFTTISEELGSAKRLIEMLNFYMTPMVEIITSHKGTVDKFIGDAIMAYWNAPVSNKRHADLAVHSAVKQIQHLESMQAEIVDAFGVEVNIGIGINTGVATVGEMGSEGRSDYTIIGDPVNLASRLEGLCKRYGARIIISEFTKRLLHDIFYIRSLDYVVVKGKHEAVEIFEVLPQFDANIERYHQAIKHFRAGELTQAKALFEALQLEDTQKLYGYYIERCSYFIDNADVTFDAVVYMTDK